MKFDSDVQKVLERFLQREAQENQRMKAMPKQEGMAIRDEFLLPVGREVGELLHSLVLSSKAKTILEVGTSYGFSTLFLADAAKRSGAKVISLELADYKQEHASAALQEAGLVEHVEFRCGDAIELIAQAPERFDLVLIDIWKELYVPVLEQVYLKMRTGGLIIADNILYPEMHRADAERYQSVVRDLPNIINSQVVNIGSGLEISCYWPTKKPG